MLNPNLPKKSNVYNSSPDYTRPLLQLSSEQRQWLLGRLKFLYGEATATQYFPELERLLKVHHAHKTPEMQAQNGSVNPAERFTEKDIALITYGDILLSESASPLATLANFLECTPGLRGVFNTLHILPFFPYSSDRGFSITDFKAVDPNLGSWQDIELLGQRYRLMFDGVFNHASSQSKPFQEMLNGNPNYQNFATTYRSPDELTPEQRDIIVRPRTSDVLTQYQSIDGPIWVWTTFSPDQIDLNFTNPKVLLEVIDTLLLYVRRGADIIRLDAVTYLWEEPGTPCANLAQTHEVIRLFRDVLNIAAPQVALTTETNIPHEENITYFGNGYDEAQMVYNFALPPLVLYTFYQEDATELSKWIQTLDYPSEAMTFFNILDTHDGIGLLGVKNILSEQQINVIIRCAREHGALISYRTAEGGVEEPYEINSTWFSALNLDNDEENLELKIKRMVASRSIALVLRGIPGIYLHGLVGTRNNIETVLKTNVKRDINRAVIHASDLTQDLKNPKSRAYQMIMQLSRLLDVRVSNKAFHPNGEQKVFHLDPAIFALLRISPDCEQHILTLTNVTPRRAQVSISLEQLGVAGVYSGSEQLSSLDDKADKPICAIPQDNYWYDLMGRRGWRIVDNTLNVSLAAYDVAWLIPLIELEQMIE
ncbi:MAG: sugar phosphorylase [Leptolyngbyaceae cyanobacterium MAG.088]|nr:sugar phosphorylase [Leptolyngbyaceae cyanobacterium MAG.088]